MEVGGRETRSSSGGKDKFKMEEVALLGEGQDFDLEGLLVHLYEFINEEIEKDTSHHQ